MDIQIVGLLPDGMSLKQKNLIVAALSLFKRYGFKKVSIEEICRMAEVSKVTFYKHYKTKDELIMFVVKLLFDNMWKEQKAILASDMSIKDRFVKVSLLKQELLRDLGEEILRSILTYDATKNYVEEFTAEVVTEFRELMILEQKKGTINPKLRVDVIMLLSKEFSHMYSENRFGDVFSSPMDMIEQVNELFFNGILTRDNI